MPTKIENLVPAKTIDTVKRAGLHKVTGMMAGVDEITVKEAAQIIGTKARLQRRENAKIAAGIAALAEVTEG